MPTPMLRDAETSRNASVAYHLVPHMVWDAQKDGPAYEPEAYSADGFIHLTLGIDPLIDVANLFYTADSRTYRVLAIDLEKVEASVKYEDPGNLYPHIYGLLNRDAVIGELAVERGANGEFLAVHAD